MSRHYVDSGWAWLVALAAFIIHVIVFGVSWTVGIYNAIFLEYFKESVTTTSWVGSIIMTMICAIAPVSGELTNRYGYRCCIIAGGIIASAGLIMSYFATSIYFLFFSFGIVTGAGLGLAYVPAVSSTVVYFDKYRNLAVGFSVSGLAFGTFISPPLITAIIDEYSWHGCMLITGGVVLNLCVFGAVIRPVFTPDDGHEKRKPFDFNLFKKKGFLLLCVCNLLIFFGLIIVYLHLTAFGERSGLSNNSAVMLISTIGIANLIGRITIGYLGNHHRSNVFVVYALSFIVSGSAVLCYPLLRMSYPAMTVLSVVFGFFTASSGSILPALTILIVGIRKVSSAYGFIYFFIAIGLIAGGPVAGLLVDVSGSYNGSLYLGGSMLVISGIMSLFLMVHKDHNEVNQYETEVLNPHPDYNSVS